jgi:SAM-dependent methyltransferase
VFAENVVEERAMGSMTRASLDTLQAFDAVAADYDRSNAANPMLCAMRRRAWDAVTTFVPPGSHILDLGCGPGTDDEHLARQGYRVTAIDWSPAMVAEARARVRAAGVADRVEVVHAGIDEIDRLAPIAQRFDAAYSNFGPFNCLADPAAAARLIGDRLRPGGMLIASVMGRVCPWEIGLYLAKRRWRRAAIRFRRGLVPVPLAGRTVWTRYYTPGEFERIFAAAGFRRMSRRALALFTPPPYLQAFAARHPMTMAMLQRLDDRGGAWPVLRTWGDHFLIVLRKA